MSTLWQRFGRAARLLSLSAVAILFAETKYIDEDARAAKKRKPETSLENAWPAKKTRRTQKVPESGQTMTLATPAQQTAAVAVEMVAPVAPPASVPTDQQLYVAYTRRPEFQHPGRVAEKIKTLEPVMDDFINAKTRTHLLCFRKPPRIYFGNAVVGEHRVNNTGVVD